MNVFEPDLDAKELCKPKDTDIKTPFPGFFELDSSRIGESSLNVT
jgi:hypothetical protein